jgi:hypothetical protein
LPAASTGQRALRGDEVVVDVARRQRRLQRGRPAAAGLVERVGGLAVVAGGPVEQPRDRRPDQLDVADLLGADALQQVLVRLALRSAEVDRLEQVLHHRPHLAELAAQTLLERVRGSRVRLVGLDLVDQSLHVQVHGVSRLVTGGRCGDRRPPPGVTEPTFDAVRHGLLASHAAGVLTALAG